MKAKSSSLKSKQPSAGARAARSSRAGKTLVGGYFEKSFSRSLRVWGTQRGCTLQSILERALTDFAKKHKIEIVADRG